jgi:hypothetical protein
MAIQILTDFINDGNSDFVPPNPAYHFDAEAIKVSHPWLLNGHVYTFRVIRPVGNEAVSTLDDYETGLSRVKPYYDNRPILLSLGKEGPLEVGLNLKLLSPAIRRKFIRFYLKRIMPTLEKVTDSDGNFIELDKRVRSSALSPLLGVTRAFIKQASGLTDLNFEFLIDKYKREEMINLSLLDWPDLPKLSKTNYAQDRTIATRTPISYFMTKFN